MLIMEGASPEERAQKLKEFKEIADKARVARQELKNKHWTEEEIDKLAKKFAEAQTKLPPEKRIDALLAKEAESSAAAKEAQRAISPPVVPPSARSGFEDDYRRATPDLLGRKSTSRESPMDTVEKIMREQRERDAARKREINDIMKRNREMMQQHNDAIRKSFDGIPRQRSVPPGLPQFRSPLGRPQSNPFGRNFP